MAILQLQSLNKSFSAGVSAVKGVSLSADSGEVICLLGPSGCGKTTLLRMIAGLEQPDSGEVWFENQPITNVPPHLRGVGMMFQDFALFPHKNVTDNVAFGLKMRGDPPEKLLTRVNQMLAMVDLQEFSTRRIDNLSGGEQQRVALARSLALGPRLLLLDEPLGALDRALRERLMTDLRQILKRVGVTAIYVTHDQTEAFAIADRVAVMNAGQIEQVDSPQQIFARPATPFVARFLGFDNLLTGSVTAQGIETSIGMLTTDDPLPPVGTRVTVLIKPEAGHLVPADQDKLVLKGRITAVSFRGRFSRVWVEVSGEQLTFEPATMPDLPVGSAVGLKINRRGVLILS